MNLLRFSRTNMSFVDTCSVNHTPSIRLEQIWHV
jgi:hypothetical protein